MFIYTKYIYKKKLMYMKLCYRLIFQTHSREGHFHLIFFSLYFMSHYKCLMFVNCLCVCMCYNYYVKAILNLDLQVSSIYKRHINHFSCLNSCVIIKFILHNYKLLIILLFFFSFAHWLIYKYTVLIFFFFKHIYCLFIIPCQQVKIQNFFSPFRHNN